MRGDHPTSFCTTCPCTSVSRKSRPWKRKGELGVVEAEQVEQGGVQVVDVDLVLGGVEAELVGLAEGEPPV